MTTATKSSRFGAIERLAKRVLAGEVVFFVGSGFSIDSEGNSASRLIARLLARLWALATCIEEVRGKNSQGTSVLAALVRTFPVAAIDDHDARPTPAQLLSKDNLKQLARDYYNFNEWSVSAFGVLASEMLSQELAPDREAITRKAHALENELLRDHAKDATALEPIVWDALQVIPGNAKGKALFLDTMGFNNPAIMGGEPRASDIDAVVASYRDRMRPRHHALARLAREGFVPCLVTTNYDLLLEGAYRLAGFTERGAPTTTDDVPPTTVARVASIASAFDFFARGEGHRTALVTKIHGCVEAYREARAGRGQVNWENYLPSMVFTYREIQTWRNDAWSRDFVRTMARTHTLAFCGYSGADPVVHSTFRDVYEEMARARVSRAGQASGGESSDAPVFFFDVHGKREFHSFEILRAASVAAGHTTGELAEHPNYVEFHFPGKFPGLDDHFRWLVHRVLRRQQVEALRSRLRRLAPRLLGHACPDADFEALTKSFDELCTLESELVGSAADVDEQGRAFESVVGWTWHFLPGLLRELALAELVESRQGPGTSVHGARRWPWYFPASERPEWTAWAAVLELAVRRMVAVWRGGDARAPGVDFEWLAAEDSPHAAIAFARGEAQRQPHALVVRLVGLDRLGRAPSLVGAYRRVTTWELDEQDVPWRVEPRGRCPRASDVWKWATGACRSPELAAYHLGA